jgi:hypothetical protein
MTVGSLVSASTARISGAVTPSDSTPAVWSYLYVGTGGNLTIIDEAGNTTLIPSLPNGSWVWVRTSYVKATGTAASGIVGFK